MKRFVIVAAVLAFAHAAFAQPEVPPTGAPGATPTPNGGTNETTPPTTAPGVTIDEQTRALIADEVAKALAAERAKHFEASLDEDKPKDPNADPLGDDTYLHGADGVTDTRLNMTFVNENTLGNAHTVPPVYGWHFGVPSKLGTMFFDNYDTRYSGYETMSHFVMYRNYRRDHLEAEAGLVIKLTDAGTGQSGLSDDGSYILVAYWKDPEHKDPRRISLTAFPVSADRFRLGYSYRLSWGGNDEFRRVDNTPNSAQPGVKLQFDGGDHYAFVGMKSALVLNHGNNDLEARLSYLAGAGVDLANNMVRVELNGGYFNRGPNELQDVQSQDVQLFGASAQVALHKGMPVTSSLDYKLYKNDPERIGRVFQPVVYKPGVQWLVMGEGTVVGQTLKDPEKTGSTKIQYGKAGDVNVRVMIDHVRIKFDLSYRDLAFVLHSVPSIPSYTDFPMAYSVHPDFFGDVGIDKNWADRYTLGIAFGIERPAYFTSPTGVPGDVFSSPSGTQTVVVRNNGGFDTDPSILPAGKDPLQSVAVKATGQINFGAVYGALINVYYQYDPNRTEGGRDSGSGEFNFTFGQLNQIGADVTLQAKF